MTEPKRLPNPMPVSHVVEPGKELFASPDPRDVDGPLFADTRKPKQRRTPDQRYRKDTTPVRPGDVLAAGLNDGRCPVGIVTSVDDAGFQLDLYSWITGRFSAGTAIVRHEQVREFSDLAVQDDGGVFQMDPLAAFQTAWTEARK